MTTGRKSSNSIPAQPVSAPKPAGSAIASPKPATTVRGSTTNELSGDDLFGPRKVIPSLNQPPAGATRPSLGPKRRISVSGMAPPPPPVPIAVQNNEYDNAELDFEFSAPIDSFVPGSPNGDESDEGPALELEGNGTDPNLNVDQLADALAATGDLDLDFAAPIPEPQDSIDLDFGDMVGEEQLQTEDESDELFLKPAVSVAPLSHYANISSTPPARVEPSVPSPELPLPPPEVPTIEPAAQRPPGRTSSSSFSAQRQAERIERAWHLIENSQFDDAQDVMEILRASGETEEVRSLQRSLDERVHEHRLELLGGPSAVLSVVTGSAMLRTMNIDPRAAFVFSLVDGVSSIEDLCDIANMPPTHTVMFLVDLVERGLVR